MRFIRVLLGVEVSEESSFDLISVHGPIGIRLFHATVEFQVGAWTDLFDEFAEREWFSTMNGPRRFQPATDVISPEWQPCLESRRDKARATRANNYPCRWLVSPRPCTT